MPGILLAFRISVFGLVCLGSLILAFAEGAAWPALLTPPLGLLAFFLTERTRRIELSPIGANLLGLLAFVAAGMEFSRDSLESRFLALAHLLVYLTWVLFFQPKRIAQYWWLCALAVLQVAVGTVLTKSSVFGASLVLFLFAAIWTLAVFSLCQAHVRIGNRREFAELAGSGGSRFRAFDAFPAFDSRSAAATRAVGARGGKRGVGGDSTWAAELRRPALVEGTAQCGPGERWISWRFLFGVLATTSLSLLLVSMFFALVPRIWVGNRDSLTTHSDPGTMRTGFADEVQLGDIGQILESTEQVFDVRLVRIGPEFRTETVDVEEFARGNGYGGDGEPLFRGAVLGQYRSGRWSAHHTYEAPFSLSQRTRFPIVRQDYRLRGGNGSYLFAMPPVAGCLLGWPVEGDVARIRDDAGGPRPSRHQPQTGTILRPKQDGGLHYSAYSPLDADGRAAAPDWSEPSGGLDRATRNYYLELPVSALPRLIPLARDLAGHPSATAAGIRRDRPAAERAPDDAETARRLVRYLRDEGGFTYSLDVSIEDVTIDPVEDFLFNRRSGHCEYYASALALMLRAAGVPARLVSGFKGGSRNRFTGWFEVEERHAHAWVEAYVDDRWIALDATPSAARNASLQRFAPSMPSWREFASMMNDMWNRYVLQMTPERQSREVYEPIHLTASAWWEKSRPADFSFAALWSWLREVFSSPEKWLSWQAWVVTFLFLIALAGVARLLRRLWRPLRELGGLFRSRRRAGDSGVPFYDRFRAVCRSRGLDRDEAQTPREFARAVAQAFGDPLARADLARFPIEVVDWFYRVRYGNRPLDQVTEERLEARLVRLEQALAESNGLGRPKRNST
ncbi:MAG: transglutaminaseTgpA domain-containing protein [Planctomycetaceae bacterium]